MHKDLEVWHHGLENIIKVPFYRLNMIDNHNNNMNNVDISDQLRTVYRYDRWMRKQKWWWSIAFWAFQILKTNTYIIYCKYNNIHIKEPMSHYKFIEIIALTWLDEGKYGPKRQSSRISQSVPIDSSIILSRISARRTLYISITSSTTTRGTVSPSYNTISSTSKITIKSMKVINLTIYTINGALKMRLDRSIFHLPQQNMKKYAGCKLHKWAAPLLNKYKINLCYCPECKVTIFLQFFRDFHFIPNIINEKQQIPKRIMKHYEELNNNSTASAN